jgi:nucleoside-diphosphate-sugar epimerase
VKIIFLTGATGYIGNQLVKNLLDQGDKVHALVRSQKKAKKMVRHPNLKYFSGDLSDIDTIENAMKGCTEVYHLAAIAKVWHQDPFIFDRVNLGGTRRLLKAARRMQVHKVVFTSTAGVFGPSIDGSVINEDSKQNHLPVTQYDKTKSKAEQLVQSFVKKGMHVVTVNPTRVYGPGLNTKGNSVTLMIQKYLEGKFRMIPGAGKQVANYAFINDVVKGHVLAMKFGKPGERYILGGENLSYRELFTLVQKVSKKKYMLFPISSKFIKSLGYLELLRANWTERPPFITPEFAQKLMLDWRIENRKAMNEINYRPIAIAEGIEKTITWLNQQNGLFEK